MRSEKVCLVLPLYCHTSLTHCIPSSIRKEIVGAKQAMHRQSAETHLGSSCSTNLQVQGAVDQNCASYEPLRVAMLRANEITPDNATILATNAIATIASSGARHND